MNYIRFFLLLVLCYFFPYAHAMEESCSAEEIDNQLIIDLDQHPQECNFLTADLHNLMGMKNNLWYLHRPSVKPPEAVSALLFSALYLQTVLDQEKNDKENFIKQVISRKEYPALHFDNFHKKITRISEQANLDIQNPWNQPYKLNAIAQKFKLNNIYHLTYRADTGIDTGFLKKAFNRELTKPYSCLFLLCRYEKHVFLISVVNFSADGYEPLIFITDPQNQSLAPNNQYHEIIKQIYQFYSKKNPAKEVVSKTYYNSKLINTGFKKIKDIIYNNNGTKIVIIGEQDNHAEIWDPVSMKQICRLDGHTGRITCAVFHPTKDLILTGSQDGSAKVWNTESGVCMATVKSRNQLRETVPVTSVLFSAEGHILTGLSKNGSILWISNGDKWCAKALMFISEAEGAVQSQCLSEDHSMIFIGTASGVLHSYRLELNTNTWYELPRLEYENGIEQLYSHDNNVFLILNAQQEGYNFASLQLPDPQEAEVVAQDILFHAELMRELKHMPAVSYNKYSKSILFASDYKVLEVLLSGKNDKAFGRIPHNQTTKIAYAMYNKQGTKLLVASETGSLKIWDLNDHACALHKKIKQPAYLHNQTIKCARFSPVCDERFITSSLQDGSFNVWQRAAKNRPHIKRSHDKPKQCARKSKRARVEIDPDTVEQTDSLCRILKTKSGNLKKIKKHINRCSKQAINRPGTCEFTPLVIAASCCSRDIIDCLINEGADVNIPSRNGFTALHFAAALNRLESIKCLIEHHAAVEIKNKFEKTPIDIAREKNQPEIIALLERELEIEF